MTTVCSDKGKAMTLLQTKLKNYNPKCFVIDCKPHELSNIIKKNVGTNLGDILKLIY